MNGDDSEAEFLANNPFQGHAQFETSVIEMKLFRAIKDIDACKRAPQRICGDLAVWRHGNRAAFEELYPIFEANWTFGGGGLGELTPLGMSQMNDLGRMFRRIYVEEQQFLSQKYVAKEIYVASTNSNRTIISAMSLLYGLFPPGAWNLPGVDYPINPNWQPGFTFVPIHPDDHTTCVAGLPCSCARFNELQEKGAELPEVQTTMAKMLAMNSRIAVLYNITADPNALWTFPDAWKMQRVWFNETLYRELPFYSEQLYREVLTTFKPFKQMMGGTFENSSQIDKIDISHETMVIQSGSFLNELYNRAQEKANCIRAGKNCTGYLKPLKFYGYSSHDLVLYTLLVPLGLSDLVTSLDGWPDTAAALTIEMYSNPGGQFFVKLLYRDNSLEDFNDVTGRVCNGTVYCRLEDFEKVVRMVEPLPDFQTKGIARPNRT
ncbi:hypothetical protein CAEBREN_15962 [Caenorhabditis brenneri]|uniref:Histidine acid phosphatase n=1 Tax=Caenorhabditis brenneri TaxID=135651 RepID=G0NNX4_CAEBE|nr:hypothetical protein CAEBREN_15962 [Caenorhabditis brenneri]